MDTSLSFAINTSRMPLGVLGGTDNDFSTTLEALRAELAPSGLVESVMVDRVVMAVARLRALVAGGFGQEASADELAQAEHSMDRALDALITARSARTEGWGHPAQGSTRIGDVSSMAPLTDGSESANFPAEVPATLETKANDLIWRDHLIFDEHVSDESPVVRGTWITAGQVISLIVDGWSRSDILQHYPELSERDIQACLAYTVEQDGPIAF